MMKKPLSSFLQSKFNVYLCSTIGWRWARRYVRLLGALYFLFRRKEKRLIADSIGTVFANGKTPPELRRLRKAVMSGIVTHYYEKLFNACSSDQASRRFFGSRVLDDGLFTVKTALSGNRGALLVTGHYGGVEFIPGYLGAQGIPVSIVVRFASDGLRQLSRSKGRRFRIRIIDADRTSNVFFAICRHLKQNRVVITQCDEIDEWRPSAGSCISFLGRRTAPDRTLNVLLQRTGCTAVFALMHRTADAGYRFIARDLEAAAAAVPGARTLSPAEIGLKFVENFIYRYPQEWYLWKKVPAIEAAPASAGTLRHAPSFSGLAPSVKAAA